MLQNAQYILAESSLFFLHPPLFINTVKKIKPCKTFWDVYNRQIKAHSIRNNSI